MPAVLGGARGGGARLGRGSLRAACGFRTAKLVSAYVSIGTGRLHSAIMSRVPDTFYAGVVRVSHMGARKADDADFHSERDQVTAMEAAAGRLGAVLDVLPPELDVSGGLPLEQRPALLAAVEGVESGRYAGIIIAYQSRLGRDVEYEEAVWRRVEAAGGRIEMAMDGLDTTTVDGKMLRRIRSAMNAAERERHVERFDDLRLWACEAGIWSTRVPPRGYDRDPQTRRLVRNSDASKVAAVFRGRASGASMSQLGRDLGMTTSGVRNLLRNRVYLGELRNGPYLNPAAHEAIVTVEEWEAAQIWVPRPAQRNDGPALLAGLVRCQACGHALTRGTAKVPIYGHGMTSSSRECPAPAAITLRLLDEHVTRVALAELRRLKATAREARADVAAVREEVDVARRELAAYLSAVSAADIGADAFGAGARQRQDVVAQAEERLRHELALQPGIPDEGTVDELWEGLDAHGRNALLRGLIEAVVVRRAGGRGARVPLEDRVRVVGYGAGVAGLPVSGGAPVGVRPIVWEDLDGEVVLGLPVFE